MKKMIAVLAIIIVVLSTVCGVLFYQIGDLQSQNGKLQSYNIIFRDMILEYQKQTSQLENQIGEYQDQIGHLENQISALENQIADLQDIERRGQIAEEEAERMRKISSAYQVKITGITYDTEWFGGLAYTDWVTVTVKNFGQYEAEDLTISVSLLNDTLNPPQVEEAKIKRLEGGEEGNVTVVLGHPLGPLPHWIATLKFEDIFLDEYVS